MLAPKVTCGRTCTRCALGLAGARRAAHRAAARALGRRGWHAVAEVLCGLFMPVLLGLALLLIGSVMFAFALHRFRAFLR